MFSSETVSSNDSHPAQVPLVRDHAAINELLLEQFGSHPAWPKLLRCEISLVGTLCFFPVNNAASPGADPVGPHLRSVLTGAIYDEPFVQARVPFTWLALFDKMQDTARYGLAEERSFLELETVFELAAQCSIVEQRVVLLALQFFHELGLVMFHPESALRHTVIMDPLKFLVDPASRIVCQHGVHHIELHEKARQSWPLDYRKFVEHGRLSKRLLRSLWEDRQPHLEELTRLMVKYGLLIPLLEKSMESNEQENLKKLDKLKEKSRSEYLVPARLPLLVREDSTMGITPVARAVFIFGLERPLMEWRNRGYVTVEEVLAEGFLPSGLFVQVRCLLAPLFSKSSKFIFDRSP